MVIYWRFLWVFIFFLGTWHTGFAAYLEENDFVSPNAVTYDSNTNFLSCDLSPENIKRPLSEVLDFIKTHEDLVLLDRLIIENLPLDELSLPKLSFFENLRVLLLSKNDLTEFPYSILNLNSLKILSITENNLTTLPPKISQLKLLDKLDLSHNKLSMIPAEIKELTKLRVLRLDNNQLNSLPKELKSCSNLAYLKLENNRFDIEHSWGHYINEGCNVSIEKHLGPIFLQKPLFEGASPLEKFERELFIYYQQT